MRFLTLEECSDSELHCIYHDPERTITLLHPRTACSLQVYAPQDDSHVTVAAFHARRPNNVHAWWLQRLGVVGGQVLGIAHNVVQKAVTTCQNTRPQPVNRASVGDYLASLRTIIPHYDVLDEEEHIREVEPLTAPWLWPLNTYYREARRGYIRHLTEPLIVELINHGLLVANETGIRWKHLDQYILLKVEGSVVDLANWPQLMDLDARMRQANTSGEDDMGGDRPATPLVDPSLPPLKGEKKVRLSAKSSCVSLNGNEQIERVEDVTDNEGKTATRMKDARKARKRKERSEICWDSDRGF
ncbi:hypothetical protein E8E13_002741 [Curvularia kusanoi]|uniref:Uncharacterized protein n=1 Tax=Curvularia kusanoi TaxID=90978 RepID=A0A9P4T631_CURKU|nr:hypothetical protein E8E13_002741 [Curvularia kusanoi]